VAAGTWEHPSPPDEWDRMLRDRHFENIRIDLLEQEAALALARRPA
jgi:hypothetical protein